MAEQVELAVTPDAVSTEDRTRADVYALLAALLARPPDGELLARLRLIEAASTGDGDASMSAAWAVLKQSAERARPELLADEYQELFIGIGRGELVPYGSWYLTGFLLERPLAELRVDLKRLGFERQEGVHEPEDHAAALCETMSLLAASPDVTLAEQGRFFEKHVGPWMGRFFGDLASAKSAHFYRAVGLLGERFLEIEHATLAMPV